MVMGNENPKLQPGGKPRPRSFFGIFGRRGRLICTLQRAEVDAMIDAKAHGRYKGWIAAIMAKYNLQRSNFWVNENNCGLYYRD